jgi:hypothetical protein
MYSLEDHAVGRRVPVEPGSGASKVKCCAHGRRFAIRGRMVTGYRVQSQDRYCDGKLADCFSDRLAWPSNAATD